MNLPMTPGVYIMKNKQGKIIYIGKAKKLKNRVSQYFGSQNKHAIKVRKMVENVNDFDYILTDSEFEALVLEASLIKQNQPKYNILLKDDKGYSYIKVTRGEYPKISAVLQKDDNADYIGPFTSSYSVKQSVDEANKIFRLPQCNKKFPDDFRKGRPCLNFHINRCMGVCTGKISKSEYDEAVNSALDFLNGDISKIIRELKEKMNTCAENLDFENAGKYRDRIRAIENMQTKQKVVTDSDESKDVFAVATNENDICIVVLRYSNGRLSDSEHFFFDAEKMVENVRCNFLIQYYGMNRAVPQKILVDEDFEDIELVSQHLTNVRGKKCSITVPKRSDGLKLVNMCRENAFEKLAGRKGKKGVEIKVLEELRELLGMDKVPEYIESYDISHTGGEDNVAGMVVFKNGKPLKRAYRTFNIKSFAGQDDYGSMREVLERRFNEYLMHKNENAEEGFGKMPDLILLDGGKGQVSAVKEVLDRMNIDVSLFGMVKDSKHKTRAITGDGGEIAINSNRSVFTLVSEIQEEVHRFSVGFHHKKHTKRGLELSLTKIDGIGEVKAKELLKIFKTIKAIKEATVTDLMQVKGINKELAEKIYEFYNGEE